MSAEIIWIRTAGLEMKKKNKNEEQHFFETSICLGFFRLEVSIFLSPLLYYNLYIYTQHHPLHIYRHTHSCAVHLYTQKSWHLTRTFPSFFLRVATRYIQATQPSPHLLTFFPTSTKVLNLITAQRNLLAHIKWMPIRFICVCVGIFFLWRFH